MKKFKIKIISLAALLGSFLIISNLSCKEHKTKIINTKTNLNLNDENPFEATINFVQVFGFATTGIIVYHDLEDSQKSVSVCGLSLNFSIKVDAYDWISLATVGIGAPGNVSKTYWLTHWKTYEVRFWGNAWWGNFSLTQIN